VVALVRKGNYIEVAAAASGISKPTFYKWLHDGANAKVDCLARQFSNAIEKAEAEAEQSGLARIARAKDWTATAWRLERRHPERWGRRERHEHTGEGGGPIELLSRASLEVDIKITRLVARLQQLMAAPTDKAIIDIMPALPVLPETAKGNGQ
jgi:AcrR family transcriptional regulator